MSLKCDTERYSIRRCTLENSNVEMESDELAKRIMFDISCAFKREPNIDEFDIIPVLESQNKSPVIVIGTKIGLQCWCVKFLYFHVYSNLMKWRERKLKTDETTVTEWTEIALLLNPGLLTVWNIRKELVSQGRIEESDEIRLSKLILTNKPKSAEVFSHRRWFVKRKLEHPDYNSSNKEALIKNELLLSTIAASHYPNNYYAWSHRQWVHDTVAINALGVEVLLNDMKWSEGWVQGNVSDHSGLQFRQYLLTTLAKYVSDSRQRSLPRVAIDTKTLTDLLAVELNFIHNLIRDFPGHETLWYHCRFVTQFLFSLGALETDSVGPICKRTKVDFVESCRLLTTFKLEDEIQFTNGELSDGSQVQLASRHLRWLSQVFGTPKPTSSS